MKKFNELDRKTKIRLARIAVKIALFGTVVLSLFLTLGSILSDYNITITLNWVQLLIGLVLFVASVKVFYWLFPVRRFNRRGGNKK